MTDTPFFTQVDAFSQKVRVQTRSALTRIGDAVYQSIVLGSPVTGAEGQPVGQYGKGYHEGKVGGTLRASWGITQEMDAVKISTSSVPYARPIEEGVGRWGPMRLRSSVGGFHSVKLTIAGFSRLVKAVMDGSFTAGGGKGGGTVSLFTPKQKKARGTPKRLVAKAKGNRGAPKRLAHKSSNRGAPKRLTPRPKGGT